MLLQAGDSHNLLYTRMDECHRPSTVFWHQPLSSQRSDTLFIEEQDDEFFLDVNRTKDDRFVTINSNSKETSEVKLVYAPL